MTRQQHYLTRALDDIMAVKQGGYAEEVGKIYGGLCHSFPVLVRACGLCQALAFVEAKAGDSKGNWAQAYTLLRQHVAGQLGTDDPLDTIAKADMLTYLRYTRTILSAWVYYKRFAVSILKVESASTDGEEVGP